MNAPAQPKGRTPALIVGAGPVGLIAAIRLREQGIDVRIVDEQTEAGKHTYPVLLHPGTLRILDALGVTAPLEWRGRFVSKLAIHTDGELQTELQLPAGPIAPGALTMPQDVLRRALVHRLASLGVDIEWQTSLRALEQDAGKVTLELVRREVAEGSRPSASPEWVDLATQELEVDYVIGADGRGSAVRRALHIEMVSHGSRELYAFFDAPDTRASAHAHLVLGEGYGSTVYPLQGDWSRFSFQVATAAPQAPGLGQLQQLLARSMPWYGRDIDDFAWSGTAEFHPALAERFGEGRVWLAGDAAHVTGPLGGQSINVGMREAEDLARRVAYALQGSGTTTFGPYYGEQRRIEWSRLFGLSPNHIQTGRAPEWVRRHLPRLLPSLPASGDDLDDLLEQLRVTTC